MFVLQDCSICFEDYNALRIPHSISCGHVFCRPCLDSLVTSTPNCPNCRASFVRDSIRKVVCAHQDPPTLDASTSSEAEMMMWQEIASAAEAVDDYERRKSLVRDNPTIAVQEAGFSKNMVVALDVMRLLVQIESKNGSTGVAHAIEESLRDRITFLEMQLSGTKTTFSTHIQDIQMVLAKMQQFESSIYTTDERTPQTTDLSLSASPLQTLVDTPRSPQDNTHATSSQNQLLSPHQPKQKQKLPQSAWSTESPSSGILFPVTTPIVLGGPPTTTMEGSSYQLDTLRIHYPPYPSVVAPLSIPSQPPSESSQGLSRGINTGLLGEQLISSSQPEDSHLNPSSSRPQPSSSIRTPTRQTITALINYGTSDSRGLSLIAGETVELVDDSDDVDDGRKLVWCRVRGIQGYVPRYCLRVTNGS
ncbi:hypothetical protein BDV93DRAFT_545739 [Ceratobasidium sp. AG-I]|nr:hypothetical protein BDV93DRAFT_545739 [Ceratobasidium sp. AG-I]